MGVLALPSRVTGLSAISMNNEITFIPGRHGISYSSQKGWLVGVAWRLILKSTLLSAMSSKPFCPSTQQRARRGPHFLPSAHADGRAGIKKLFRVVTARTRFDERGVHRLPLKARLIRIGRKVRLGRLQEPLVVALRKIRLVVRAARFVAQERTLGDHARQLQHVVELPRKHERLVGPHRLVA